jgi:hypothetical protein
MEDSTHSVKDGERTGRKIEITRDTKIDLGRNYLNIDHINDYVELWCFFRV